jgi:hypothetical protein
MPRFLGTDAEMHAMCRRSMLLSRKILSKTAPLHPMPNPIEIARLLLPKTAAMHAVFSYALLPEQLLPKTLSAVLLARE